MKSFYLVFLCLFAAAVPAFAEYTPNNISNECDKGRHHVASHPRSAYYRSDGTYVSAATVRSHCRDNQNGFEFWRDKIKTDRPDQWPYTEEKSKKWSVEEKEKLLDALGNLGNLFNLDSIKGIFRLDRSIYYPNPASVSKDGKIVIYDSAFDAGRSLDGILTHEISHILYWNLGKSEKDAYLKIAGWEKSGNPNAQYIPTRDGYVEPDGRLSPDEDFANNMEYLFSNPQKLREVSPKIFIWLNEKYQKKINSNKDVKK
ncbi:MAG: hypothetical protein A2583_11140 [Bdellovibrionales bacterium RIFOXYD1_FULL_53_11]|nr:MAG: hypothetical protein A2583_11140 [Bdellovibrionales bacterium RIFOXYD1_FULL_53_11]